MGLGAGAALLTVLYGMHAMLYHSRTGVWLYPFLDHTLPFAPVVFLALYACTWVFVLAFASLASALRASVAFVLPHAHPEARAKLKLR